MQSTIHRTCRKTALLAACWLAASLAVANGAAPIDTADYDGVIRVACIGDSITFGAGIRDSVIRQEAIPAIRAIAEETGVSLINLYDPLSDKPELFPDKIHPNAAGAGLMAAEIFRALTGRKYEAKPEPAEAPVGATP